MAGKLRVYVGSPLGFSDAGRYWLKEYLLPKLSNAGVDVINPWAYTMDKDSMQLRESARAISKKDAIGLGEKDIEYIKSSDIVLAVLDGTDVDSGVAAEIGYAYGIGKKIMGYRGDFRFSSDAEPCVVNLMVDTFIEKSGGRVCLTVDEVISELKRISK